MTKRTGLQFTAIAAFFLSLGALREVSAEDAAVLMAPKEIHSGGRSALTLTTFNAQTRDPVSRRAIVRLLDGERMVAQLFNGMTGAEGRVHVPFEVPDTASGGYRFEAQVSRIEDALTLETMVSRAPAILIETDKPIYKPSQVIKGRVVLVNNAMRPVAGEVEVSFHDAKGIRIDRRTLQADEFGAAPFSLQLASEVNFGIWKVKARSEEVESIRDVRVEEYTLPRFNLGLEFERDWTLVDQEVQGTVDARYFFGRGVEGTCYIVARRYVGEWQEYASIEGQLTDGLLNFTLPPVDFVAGAPEKCRYVVDELGLDACVSHRDPDLPERLAEACPDGIDVYFNATGNPGMATGGSGDVLTGCLAALCCVVPEPLQAARIATWAHGDAGDRAARRLTETGLTASDLLDDLAPALQEFLGGEETE